MNHRELKKEFTQKTFLFRQVWREGDFAIYEKTSENYRGYEAIKIRRHDGYTIGGVYCEPSEVYPSDKQWGVLGLTTFTFEEAQKCIDKLQGVNIVDEPEPEQPKVKRGRGRPRKVKT